MSHEADFLGGLLPSHPDLELVIDAIRTKYGLREVYPQDDPIKDIFLGDEIVTLEQFAQDVKNQILESVDKLFPEDYVKKYRSSKNAIELDYQKELGKFSDELKPAMEAFFEFTKNASLMVYKILDAQIDQLVATVCNHLLLGDSMEVPQDWFGKVFTTQAGEETIILAMISEVTNLDLMFQQIRHTYKKTYGKLPVKVTRKTASTGYYLQLARRNKDADFILDEFIRLNKLAMPKKTNSLRYAEVRTKYRERLKKRLQKAKLILEAIGRENK